MSTLLRQKKRKMAKYTRTFSDVNVAHKDYFVTKALNDLIERFYPWE